MVFFKRINYNSPVILTYSLLALFVLILNMNTGGNSNMYFFSVYHSDLSDPLYYFRLFSHILGHASPQHFVNNFIIILLIGPMLEEKYGSINLFSMIILTALITGLVNNFFFKTALLGASGVAFMLIILGSFVNLQKNTIPLTFVLVVLIFIGKEILDGAKLTDNISQTAHITGGIFGAIMGFFINKFKEGKEENVENNDELS